MEYFKNTDGDYLISISTGAGMEQITAEEYEHILSEVRSAPEAEEGFRYRLKTDLTWELDELPPKDMDSEISDSEALAIILGGAI
jgi:predicted amino acid dehydrogenase